MVHTPLLQLAIPDYLQETIAGTVAILPRIVGAIVILAIGWIVGRFLGSVVARIARRGDLDGRLRDTPVTKVVGSGERSVSRALGKVTSWYVYLLAFLAAANTLAIDVLSTWISEAVSYLPAIVAGVLLILVGFVFADFIADAIARTETITDARYTSMVADGVRFFVYFVVLVMGLDTMGVDVQILYLFAQALAVGLAVGVALAIGIAFGWGGKDYVANHIEGWMGRPQMRFGGGLQTGGGVDED
jgi:small-conductance mechanosensitive channel